MTTRHPLDPDVGATRRAARRIGLQLGVASSALALVIVLTAFVYIVSRVPPGQLFSSRHEAVLDVGGLDFLRGAIVVGLVTILAAAVLSWFVALRAVRPLGNALRLQRAFVANASHELRTPLAVLDARLQALQRRTRRGGGLAGDSLAELRRDTATLIRIVNDLLDAADDSPVSATERAALGPALGLAVESMRLLAAERSVTIEDHVDGALEVRASTAAVHRCAVALLDNAVEHSPAGGTIELSADRVGRMVRIRVRDHGAGVRGIAPDRVFDRFARGEGGAASGFGIGLALVADTARRYGGSASVVRSDADGAEFALDLPLATTPARRRVTSGSRLPSTVLTASERKA